MHHIIHQRTLGPIYLLYLQNNEKYFVELRVSVVAHRRHIQCVDVLYELKAIIAMLSPVQPSPAVTMPLSAYGYQGSITYLPGSSPPVPYLVPTNLSAALEIAVVAVDIVTLCRSLCI